MTDYKEYVYAVYAEKSFSKAAKKLFVSQPWLSSTIKKVEQELGLPLFDRSTTPISLTEAGQYYIQSVEKIMAIEEEMHQQFRQLHETEGAELHIGSSMFFCTYVLPNLLADFRATYPQVTLTFSEGNSRTLSEKLSEGKLDFILEVEKPESGKLHTIPWASEELVLAVPSHFKINQGLTKYCYTFHELLHRHNPGQQKLPVPLQAFQKESFIFLNEGHDSYLRSLQICKNAGFRPNVSMYLSQMMTAYYLVCEGRGITFLRSTIPEYVYPSDSVVFYQLDDPLAVRNIYLSYPKRKISPMRQHLIDFIKEETILDKPYANI